MGGIEYYNYQIQIIPGYQNNCTIKGRTKIYRSSIAYKLQIHVPCAEILF
nr:MAG TPA: hypothetical protein [Crassvirales sp.]